MHLDLPDTQDLSREQDAQRSQDFEQELETTARAAAEQISRFTTVGTYFGREKAALREPDLSPCAVKYCRGILFYSTTRVGLGVSLRWGKGFLVRQLGPEYAPRWSAPLLYKETAASIGLTAGYKEIHNVIVLSSDEAVERCLSCTPVTLGEDISVLELQDLNAAAEGAFDLERVFGPHAKDALCISEANGVLLDWSDAGGTLTVDHEANAWLYGPDVTPSVIVSGALGLPPAFEVLYAALNSAISSVVTVHRRSGSGIWRIDSKAALAAVPERQRSISSHLDGGRHVSIASS